MAITRVNSRDILDRTIKNVDISDSAEIADTKLATISTSGKVANSATTGTSAATPNTIVLRDGSGNANFNAINATQSVTSDTLVRAPAIEGSVSIAVVSDDRTTPPIMITRNNVGAGIMTGLDQITVTGTVDTGTLQSVHVATTTGTIAEQPVNGTDIANKDYVDSVATAGSITGDLAAGRVVLSTGLHTVSDSDKFVFDPVAKTFSLRMDTGTFPNEVGISITDVANGTMGLYADEFTIYAPGADGTAFTVSCPDANVLLSFHGRTPIGLLPTVDLIPDPTTRRSLLQILADGLVDYGLFEDAVSLPTYPWTPVKVAEGGTGLGELGAALEVLRVNAGGTALEYSSAGAGDVSGTFLTNGNVPYATGVHTLETSVGFTFDPGDSTLTVAGAVNALNLFESGNNIAVGSAALNRSYVSAGSNVAIGPNTLSAVTYGTGNIAIGMNSQKDLDGNNNIAIGLFSQFSLVTGNGNIAIGNESQYGTTVSYNNIGIGSATHYGMNGGVENIAIGMASQHDMTTGNYNTALGSVSQSSGTTGEYNVCIGYATGHITGSTLSNVNALTSGSYNTFIGTNAGFNTSTQRTNATAIGYQAYVDADNTVVLGNAAVTTVMAGSTGAARVRAGSLTLSGLSAYANNAAAISGGLTAGQLYMVAGSNPRTLAIVY